MDIDLLLSQMTLEEKCALLSGDDFWHTKSIPRLGIPRIRLSDGPHGLRKLADSGNIGLDAAIPATCFPAACALACSWNPQLAQRVGAAIGQEALSQNVQVVLGPGVNIKRTPLCGRNFEYFSEDPYQASTMAAGLIQGIESTGVGSSLKHYAANNQEYRRLSTDVRMDMRTLREIYLAAFETAVKEGKPSTVMCAYNSLNGQFCSENELLLTKILRDEWGFEGFTVTDWGAVNNRPQGVAAGLELEMPSPGGVNDAEVLAAVQRGDLTEETVDIAVGRLLKAILRLTASSDSEQTVDFDAHHTLAQEAAAESLVLLKNHLHLLPFQKEAKVAVIGPFAMSPRIQGGGSSRVNPTKVDIPFEEIRKLCPRAEYAPGWREDGSYDNKLATQAILLATQCDRVLVLGGLPDNYESEGYDREHLNLPQGQNRLIPLLAKANPMLAVALFNGAPVLMPWVEQVPAILECYLGGQGSAKALADSIFGNTNPSGKLCETFPLALEHTPAYLSYPGFRYHTEYTEGVFVGYRWYQKRGLGVLFPFGHGLSYTTFTYSELTLSKTSLSDNEELTVSCSVTNTGKCTGAEVVQLYVCPPGQLLPRPVRELRKFAKVLLNPQESKTVHFTLSKRDFAYFDEDCNDWAVEAGRHVIELASSSQDIRLRAEVTITPQAPMRMPYSRSTPLGDLLKDEAYQQEATHLADMVIQYSGIDLEHYDAQGREFALAIVENLPLKSLVAYTMGHFNSTMLDELLERLNQ